MSSKEIDNLVEVSLNPYLVFRVDILNTKDEYELLMDKSILILNDEVQTKIDQNSIAIDLAYNLGYVFIKQDFLEEYKKLVDICGFKYKLTEATEELWDSKDLLFLNQEDPAPELTELAFPFVNPLSILKQIFEKKYTQDDVIDKISRSGVESLNELNKHILNK